MPVFAQIKNALTALNNLGTGNENDLFLSSYDQGDLHGRVVRQDRNHVSNYPIPANPDCIPFRSDLALVAPEACVTRLTYGYQDGRIDCEIPGDCSEYIRGYWVTSESDCSVGSLIGAKAFNEHGEVIRTYQLYVSYPVDIEGCRVDQVRGRAGGICHPCTNYQDFQWKLANATIIEAAKNQTALNLQIQGLEGQLREASINQTFLNSQVGNLEAELAEASINQTFLNSQVSNLEAELAEASINQTELRQRMKELDKNLTDCTTMVPTVSSGTSLGWLGILAVAPIGVGLVALGAGAHYLYRYWKDKH